jgi:hypothetical protein
VSSDSEFIVLGVGDNKNVGVLPLLINRAADTGVANKLTASTAIIVPNLSISLGLRAYLCETVLHEPPSGRDESWGWMRVALFLLAFAPSAVKLSVDASPKRSLLGKVSVAGPPGEYPMAPE